MSFHAAKTALHNNADSSRLKPRT